MQCQSENKVAIEKEKVQNGKEVLCNFDDQPNLFPKYLPNQKYEKKNEPKKEDLPCFGYRHLVALLGFFVLFFMNAQRTAASIALVAMVNITQGDETLSNISYPKSCTYNSSTKDSDSRGINSGEFNWDSTQQGYILSASFAGYLMANIPAGRMAEMFGAKRTLFYGNLVSSILTLISPICAWWNLYALIGIQFGRGMAQIENAHNSGRHYGFSGGFSMPPIFVLMANWFPCSERGILSSLVMNGVCVGSMVTGLLTGWICDAPGLGWPYVFYVMGGLNGVFCLIFIFLYHEGPRCHPNIDQKEKDYITQGQETDLSKKRPPVPWRKMLTSVPVLSLLVGLFGYYWSATHFMTVHPAFMGTVLQYSMTENGLFSSLPFLTMALGTTFAGVFSNKIKDRASINATRKICNSLFSLGFCGSLFGVLLAGCDRTLNMISFYFAAFFIGVGLSGSVIVSGDMSPTFAGSLVGVSTTLASFSCVLLPVFVGEMTKHGTLKEWNNVFYMHISVVFLTGLFFLLFGSAKLQDWNSTEQNKQENVKTIKVPLQREKKEEHFSSTYI